MITRDRNTLSTLRTSYILKDEHQVIESQNSSKRPTPLAAQKFSKSKVEPSVILVDPSGLVISKWGGKLEFTRNMKLNPCYPISISTKLELPLECRKESDSPKKFECIYCFRTYARKHSLVRHLRAHKSKNRLKCDRCRKDFWEKSLLLQHQQTHAGEQFRCVSCNQSFNKKAHLKKHKRVHSAEKPYKCKKCPRSFARESYLKGHGRLHEEDRPFKCAQCSKVFTQKYYLRRHFRTHTGVKPFHCVHCHKLFTQKGSLTRHLKLIHNRLARAEKIEPLQKLEDSKDLKSPDFLNLEDSKNLRLKSSLKLEGNKNGIKIEKCKEPIISQVSVKKEITGRVSVKREIIPQMQIVG